ncbi:MAG TPA: S9 family peptidase, partial [Usitatibacteraceae bacterium]|nr:S9 family peptidase [Usitatibacteraceae bacterium]
MNAAAVLLAMVLTPAISFASPPLPPVATKDPVVMTKFGDRRVDDYFWLRDKAGAGVIDYLKAENSYTEAVMQPLEGFRGDLYKEMLARIKETDESVPYRRGGWWYYTREVEGLQYPIYCRRRGSMQAAEEVMLDVNELAAGKAYTGVDFWEVSPDGNYLAYGADFTGYREYTVYVKDLRSGELLPDRLERVDDVAWAGDSATLFYVQQNAAKRPDRLFRHKLGAPRDALVWEEKDELFNLSVGATRSEEWIVATSSSKDTSEVRVLPAVQPEALLRMVAKRRKGHEYYVDHHGSEFWIRTNDKGRNFRLVRAPVTDPAPGNWRQVLVHRKLVMLEEVDLFKDFWVAKERADGVLKLRVTDFATGEFHYIDMPEPVYSTGAGTNAEYDTGTFRVVYQSYITPRTVFDYDVGKRSRELLKQQPVLGGYEPGQYASEMLMATATDGTKVPVSLVYRKSLRKGAPQPLLLYGYGSYGYPLDVNFRSSRLSLLDRGMVFAIAHVRGGGDRGRLWYDDGKLRRKMNTFTDFIAAAEHLVATGWTAPDRLVIQGGSAGGLLMGAVANLRPDLFKAVVSQVPFVDVVNTMLDATLPLTTQEYIEWGNPNKEGDYKYIRKYSPYDNIERKAYPAMLVEASLNDSQVPYWEAAKYVAKLRACRTDSNVLLLKTILEAGHGGASGRYDA